MGKDVIVALDFPGGEQALAFLDKFGDERPFVKVGMELYYATGGSVVQEIKRRGHKIFLDLKLHDIPNTVGSAMKVLAAQQIDMINLHAAGTRAMMEAALKRLEEGAKGSRPLLFAVTQLTSTSQQQMQEELLINEPIEKVVSWYAQNAASAGLDGVVCSPLEAGLVKEACGQDFLTLTPGIRYADGDIGDQARVTDPARAKQIGSDYIVVGRPITKAQDPVAMWRRCVADFVG